MTGIFNIEQITQGKTLDDWYKPANHHEEKQVTTRKTNGAAAPTRDTILAIFKPGAWMKKSAIAKTLGVSPDTLTWHIGKLLVDKELIAQGNTGNRCFALPGTAEPRVNVSVAEANASKKPKAAVKPFKFKPTTRTPPPQGERDAAGAGGLQCRRLHPGAHRRSPPGDRWRHRAAHFLARADAENRHAHG